MAPSVSLVLPVCNVQHQLAAHVQRLLEVLPELSSRFEVVIVDCGSTDATSEVAAELCQFYPQVRLRQRPAPAADVAAEALAVAAGEIVFVGDVHAELSAAELRGLWSLRDDERLVMARPEPAGGGRQRRVAAWPAERTWTDTPSPLLMIRRAALASLGAIPPCPAWVGGSGRRPETPAPATATRPRRRYPAVLARVAELPDGT